MNKKLILVLVCFLLQGVPLAAQEVTPDMEVMLGSAETFFQSMQKKEYAQIWKLLSQKSRRTIVKDTYHAIRSQQGDVTKERIEQGFSTGDELSKSYWDAFLRNFDPVMVLEKSKWELVSLKRDQGQIKVTYKEAERPALLKMYREDGQWKVGLTESFWANKTQTR